MAMHCNEECEACVNSANCINGVYCYTLRRYVQYETRPPCIANEQKEGTGAEVPGPDADRVKSDQ